jgi:general secretion pathway protein C
VLDPAVNAQIVGAIRTVSPTECAITTSALDLALEHQAEVFAHVRVMPHQTNGQVDGLQFFGVRNGELLSALGIRNGDILETINQLDITTPEHALEAYSRLRTSAVLELRLTRAGAHVVLTIRRTP